ncbi:leucine-rich repeat protein SHOC-2-like [Uloborus diversus]|uniref:leucine-rich repeat protein SHOC-2-like n=1 Tax=Uloborus diversus TaxID=327109 RepID=UPI00240A4BD1|nr:leucine-rich repeat protein SHOC-2-like [Uloborus diversus]
MKYLKRCVKWFGADNRMKFQMLVLASFLVVEGHLSEHSWEHLETDKNFTCPLNEEIRPCVCSALSAVPAIHCDNIRSIKTVKEALGTVFTHKVIPFLKIQHARFVSLPCRAFAGINMTRMQIKDSNLRYVEAEAFAGLEELKILILHNVKLLNFPSESLNRLSSLTTLFLPSNSLLSVNDRDLHVTGGLKYLSLAQNQLTHVAHGSFPMSLVTLSLSDNRILRLDRSIRNLVNLEWLSLDNNRLVGVRGELNGLVNLLHLNLAYNRISSLGQSLKNLNQLETIDLQHNNIREIGTSFHSLGKLKKLNLSMNRLLRLNYGEFYGLLSIERLDLSGNKLSKLNGALRHLSGLITLDLADNEFQIFSFWEIDTLSHLKVLDLSNNHLVYLSSDPDLITLPSTSLLFQRNELVDFEIE